MNLSAEAVVLAGEVVVVAAGVAGFGYGVYQLLQIINYILNSILDFIFGLNKPQNIIHGVDSFEQHRRFTRGVERPLDEYLDEYDSSIYVIDTVEKCRHLMRAVKRHCDDYNVLGFDCEWETFHGRRPVALLQLSTYRALCVLIRLCKLEYIPWELKEILQDDNIIKVGVAPYYDSKLLYDDFGVRVASTLDLRFIAERAGCRSGKLSQMAEDYLNVSMNKDPWTSSRFSEWETPALSRAQIIYAAKDVAVAFRLFRYFHKKILPGSSSRYIIEYLRTYGYIDRNYGPQYNSTFKASLSSTSPQRIQ